MRKIMRLITLPLMLCIGTTFSFSETAFSAPSQPTNAESVASKQLAHNGHGRWHHGRWHRGGRWHHGRHWRHHCRYVVRYRKVCGRFKRCFWRHGEYRCHRPFRCFYKPYRFYRCWR